MQLIAANNAQSTLAGSISNTATVANLAPGSGVLFASPGVGQYFVGTFTDAATGLLHEIIWTTNVTGDQITVQRGKEGTTPLAWAANDLFGNLMTAGQLETLVQQAQAQSQSFNYGVDTGAVNAYVVALTPAISAAPSAGTPIRMVAQNTNTLVGGGGPTTLNAGWGAAPIKRYDGSNPIGGEIVAGEITEFNWDGAVFELPNPAPATPAALAAGTDTRSYVTPAALANASFAFSGAMVFGANLNAPAGWLLSYGQAVSRTGSTANLFAAITASSLVTLGIASPGVVNWTGHGLKLGSKVSFETTGSLPTGLSTATDYYVLAPSTNSFNVGSMFSASNALTGLTWAATGGGQITATTTTAHGLIPGSLFVLNGCDPVAYNGVYTALAGTTGSTLVAALTSNPGAETTLGQLAGGISAIAFTGSQSGSQTCRFNPFGCGDGSTTFTLPDARGAALAGADAMGGTAANRLGGSYSANGFMTAAMGNYAGEQMHAMTLAELIAHTHTYNAANVNSYQPTQGGGAVYVPNQQTGSTGGSNLFNVTQPTLLLNLFVKL
jgi:microcystin-dependent protein